MVVDHDPAVDVQAHAPRQRRLRADADADDGEVGLEERVAEVDAGFSDPLRVALQQDLHAERLDRGREQLRRSVVELALHQAVHQVHDRHVATERRQPVGGFQPEQAAADDHGAFAGVGFERLAVLGAAEHVGVLGAGDRRHERIAARAQHDAVIGVGVDRLDPLPEADVDLVVVVPALRADGQAVRVGAARQQGRERDAVVREPRLGGHEREVVLLDQRLDHGLAGDPAADHERLHARAPAGAIQVPRTTSVPARAVAVSAAMAPMPGP